MISAHPRWLTTGADGRSIGISRAETRRGGVGQPPIAEQGKTLFNGACVRVCPTCSGHAQTQAQAPLKGVFVYLDRERELMQGKGLPSPNYTQFPNIILDRLHEIETEAELRVICVIVRKTLGWHKEKDRISLTQLQQHTGMSRQGVIDGTSRALARGWIDREVSGRGFTYSLLIRLPEVDSQQNRPSDADPAAMVNKVDSTGTPDSQQNRPLIVNKVDTQKKGKETNKTKDKNPADADAPAQLPKAELDRLAGELCKEFESITKLKRPQPSPTAPKAVKQVQVTWWNPLREMVTTANGKSRELLALAVARMDEREWPISAPISCIKTFHAVYGEVQRRGQQSSTSAGVGKRTASAYEKKWTADEEAAIAEQMAAYRKQKESDHARR